eukprot:15347937-Ditylum_brightwellii.AAC.1
MLAHLDTVAVAISMVTAFFEGGLTIHFPLPSSHQRLLYPRQRGKCPRGPCKVAGATCPLSAGGHQCQLCVMPIPPVYLDPNAIARGKVCWYPRQVRRTGKMHLWKDVKPLGEKEGGSLLDTKHFNVIG